jgi:prolyl-tRNA editing enzyme YbaK/EbsC (Cys-tRNA(Pro) deacylase)
MPADPRVLADLEAASIEYEEMACDPELADTAAFCEAYGVPLERSANAIVVASRKPEGHNAVCVVLATDRLDVNGVVRRRLGVRKVSFASAPLTEELTGQEIGGVTIFGLPDDLPVWIDSRVVEHDWVVVGAGSRSAKIRFDPGQIVGKDLYEVVEGLAKVSESG